MTDEMLGRLWAAANGVEPASQTAEESSQIYWKWNPPHKWMASEELPWAVLCPNPNFSHQTYISESEAYTELGEVIRTILAFASTTRQQLAKWVETAL